jgi:molecular chaperone DnaK
VRDAEKNAADDKKRREDIDSRNRLDSLAYEVEKNAKEWSDRLSPELKTRLDNAVERARKAHRGDDANEIKAAMEELSAAYQEAGRSLYSQAQASSEPGPTAGADGGAPGAEAPPTGEAKPEDVVEADYEIVDDKK